MRQLASAPPSMVALCANIKQPSSPVWEQLQGNIMGEVFRNLDWSVLINIIISVIPALLCITIHELAHGFTAYRLGDSTAKEKGRLTFNPIKHINVFGLIMMVTVRFGWAKPVPVNMRRFKKPKRHMALTALAGPLSNVALAVVVYFAYGLIYAPLGGDFASGAGEIAQAMIERAAFLSVALAIFNILPIPPLDGSKVLFSFLPEVGYYKLLRYERFGMILLILFVFSDFFDGTVGRVAFALNDWMFGISRFAYNLVN